MSRLRGPLVLAGVVLVLVAAWQGAIMAFDVPAYLLPTPAGTFSRLVVARGMIAIQTWHTLETAAAGLLAALVLAVGLASAFAASPLLTRSTLPLVIALRTAPLVAVAPVITLVVGRGFATGVIVVVVASFFPIMVNCLRGLTAIDRNAHELIHVLGASRWQALRLLRFPSSLPFLFAGLRVAAGSAILGAMLAEWLTGYRGLGLMILESADLRDVELLWSAIIVATALALSVFWATAAAERSIVHWRDHA